MDPELKVPVKNFFTKEVYFVVPGNNVSIDDVPKIVQICSQELIYEVLFKERLKSKPYTQKDAEKFIEWIKEGWDKKEWFVFFIRNPKGEIVGAVDIKSNNFDNAEIGYWMSNTEKGLMTNAVIALCNVAKNTGYKSLYGLTIIDNQKSQNVLARAGFKNLGKVLEKGKEYLKFQNTLQ